MMEPTTNISRRTALRRGLTVGGAGAVLWTTPVVHRLGGVAAFAAGSPPPPPPPDDCVEFVSSVQLIVAVDGSREIGVNYETGRETWGKIGHGAACFAEGSYQRPTHAEILRIAEAAEISWHDMGDCRGRLRIALPPDLPIVAAAARDGQYGGHCSPPSSSNGANEVAFTKDGS